MTTNTLLHQFNPRLANGYYPLKADYTQLLAN